MPPILQIALSFVGLASFLFSFYVWWSRESADKKKEAAAAAAVRDERLKALETKTDHHEQRLQGMVLDNDSYRSGVARQLEQTTKRLDEISDLSRNVIQLQEAVKYMTQMINELKNDIKHLTK
ncbi:MAG: hypothetical protein ACRYFZ_09470 [Janthinobacterium lividum]